MSIVLKPGQATLAQLEDIWRSGEAAKLHETARDNVELAFSLVAKSSFTLLWRG